MITTTYVCVSVFLLISTSSYDYYVEKKITTMSHFNIMITFRIKEHIISSNIQLSSIQVPGWCNISWRNANPGSGDRGGEIHVY